MKSKVQFHQPSQTQIDMIDIGHKSLPIIIGPYLDEEVMYFNP